MERKPLLGLASAFLAVLFVAGVTGCSEAKPGSGGAENRPEASSGAAGSGVQEGVNRFPVQVDSQWGYIDRSGSMVIAPAYREAGAFENGRAWVKQGGKYGYIDASGSWAIEPRFDAAGSFSEGLAPVVPAGGEAWGYIDRSGELQIPADFAHAAPFSGGLAAVDTAVGADEAHASFGYIDTGGEFVVEPQFYGARNFGDGLAPVLTEGFVFGKWGYIDRSGSMVIEPEYENAQPFSEGLAAVETGDGSAAWGYIDTKGQLVIEDTKYDARSFSDGVAWVKTGFGWRLIDRQGNEQLERDDLVLADPYRGGLARVAVKESRTSSTGMGTYSEGGELRFHASGDIVWQYLDRQGDVVWSSAK